MSSRPLWGKLLRIVVIALLLRLGAMLILHTYKYRQNQDESGRIAASLARGQGFANPFPPPTGPTAWLPPLFPWVLAGVYKAFGVYTQSSAIFALGLNCLFGALTTVPVFLTANRTFGQRVATWSAWTWALLPYMIYWSIHSAWDTSLSTLLFSLVFLMTLELADRRRLWTWVAYGVLWGAALLSNTALVAFLPFAMGWMAYLARRERLPLLRNGASAALALAMVVSPWMARNYVVFHRFIPIRGNFWVELHLGNTPDANGTWQWWLHPNDNRLELNRYVELGENNYVAEKRRQALDFIRKHPGRFAVLSVKRFVYYWAGVPRAERLPFVTHLRMALFLASSVLAICGLALALKTRRPGAVLYLLLLLSFPTIYYFVFPHARYRHPIEPELLVLVVYLLSETRSAKAARRGV